MDAHVDGAGETAGEYDELAPSVSVPYPLSGDIALFVNFGLSSLNCLDCRILRPERGVSGASEGARDEAGVARASSRNGHNLVSVPQ